MVRAVGEVVDGVVEDVVGAEAAHQVDLRGAAHSRDLRAERLGQLHRVAADPAGCSDDQHLLACSTLPTSVRAWRAVLADTGTTAACSKGRSTA